MDAKERKQWEAENELRKESKDRRTKKICVNGMKCFNRNEPPT